MRDFFIGSFEKILVVCIVVAGTGVLVSGLAVMFSPGYAGGGFFAGLFTLFAGAIGLLFAGGAAFLLLGIYHNTRRAAEALERTGRG